MEVCVVVLSGYILMSFLPAPLTIGLALAPNPIISQRLTLVIAVLTTTDVTYGETYVNAFRIVISWQWKTPSGNPQECIVDYLCRDGTRQRGQYRASIEIPDPGNRVIAGVDMNPCR